MKSSYFALNRRAVLAFFNPHKSQQFIANYFGTVFALREHDQRCLKCLHSIYFLLVFQSILQVCLFLSPFQWSRLVLFDVFDESNDYPNLFKLSLSAIFSVTLYMFHMLYVHMSTEKCFQLFSDYYVKDVRTFVGAPSMSIRRLTIVILNAYQVFAIGTVLYLCIEYKLFAVRIFRSSSLLVWTEWLEFVTMNIFFGSFASALCLFIFISYTAVVCAVLAVSFLVFRFHETHRPLLLPFGRLTILRLLRFVHRNIGTMQYFFSLNRIYGPVLLAFMAVNLPMNVMIATHLLQNRFSNKQTLFMLVLCIGQLTGFFGVHLVAAAFSKRIHSPYKRIMSLNILIRSCPLNARLHLANSIQNFHLKNKKYGITYGSGKLTFGLVTMMSFAKFTLLYGKQLMYQYNHLEPSS